MSKKRFCSSDSIDIWNEHCQEGKIKINGIDHIPIQTALLAIDKALNQKKDE